MPHLLRPQTPTDDEASEPSRSELGTSVQRLDSPINLPDMTAPRPENPLSHDPVIARALLEGLRNSISLIFDLFSSIF